VLAAVVLAACTVPVATYGAGDPIPSGRAVLTYDGPADYELSGDSGVLTVSRPAPDPGAPAEGGNLRYVIWPVEAPVVADAQSLRDLVR
jgi:hypothetical protein